MKLRRSQSNRILGGVIGGIAARFNGNTTRVRLIWVIVTITPFPGLIVYLLLWCLLPSE